MLNRRDFNYLLTLSLLSTGCDASNFFGRKKDKPNILFILVDTLRADHMSYMGYPRETSPTIDALAKHAINFKAAYAACCWTAPSVASIFSGLPPSSHGMMPPNSRTKAAERFSFRMGSELPTLPVFLKDQGYKTAAVSSNEWISEKFGYTRGFDYFFMKSRINAERVNDKAFRVIDKFFEPPTPLFLYLHYFDPHDPYRAPAPFSDFFPDVLPSDRYSPQDQETIRQYDNEIRYCDHHIGKLLEYARSKGFLDNTYIIFTADHGEQFRERGNVGHGYTLHDEETHIPLLIVPPGIAAGREISTPVSHHDIFPTIQEIVTGRIPIETAGISLLSSELSKRKFGIVSEIARRFNFKSYVTAERKKVIGEYDVQSGLYVPPETALSLKLFDIPTDPRELSPLEILKDPSQPLRSAFFELFTRISQEMKRYKVDTMEMSEETFNELKSLGYF